MDGPTGALSALDTPVGHTLAGFAIPPNGSGHIDRRMGGDVEDD
jgi:hypothetical protein